jgi:hypothetical protein
MEKWTGGDRWVDSYNDGLKPYVSMEWTWWTSFLLKNRKERNREKKEIKRVYRDT